MKYVQGRNPYKRWFYHRLSWFEARYNGSVELGKVLPPEKPIAKGLILPTCVNAHTHLGDSFIRFKHLKLPRNVKDLVAPPHWVETSIIKGSIGTGNP